MDTQIPGALRFPSSLRRIAILSCAVLVAAMIVVGGAAAAGPSASTAASIKDCGSLHRFNTAIVARRVRCSTARTVGRRYMIGHRRPLGFRCRRISVQAAAGWYARCTRGGQVVRVIPE